MNRVNPITVPTFRKKEGAGAQPEDPILPLYRQWLAARAEGDDSEAGVTLEASAFWDMTTLTPTSQAGIAALAHGLWSLHGPGFEPEDERYEGEFADPTVRLILAIWRAASGKGGTPDRPIDR